jgi:TonB family protein
MDARYVGSLLLIATLGYQTARLKPVMPSLDQRTSTIGNTVVVTADVDAKGAVKEIHVLQGVESFAQKATEAISQWQFEPARFNGQVVDSEISVIFMFRPPTFSNFGAGGPSLGFVRPDIPKGNHPALPITISDPEWPVARLLNPGVVIFDLEIDDEGFIHRMRLINDVPATAGLARQTVRRWTFTPAIKDGRAVRSTMIVAISFVTPVP